MSAVGKEMGACAGKSRKHPVTPTSTGDNPRASADNSSVRDGNALIHARKIYLEQESHMNRKVKDCFEAVFSKTSDSITDLNLKFVNLGAEGMASLASILPLFPNLVNLRLWKTRIGIDGSGYLGRALLRMPQVRLLSLEDNDIRAAGLAKLMDGFRSLVDLEELFIHTNKLGPEGGLLLASLVNGWSKLKSITTDENNLEDEAAEKLIDGLTKSAGSIKLIGLSFNRLTDQSALALLANIEKFTQLKKVTFNGNIVSQIVRKQVTDLTSSITFDV